MDSGTERLLTAVQDLSRARTLDAVMEIVRHAARDISGADGATFVLRDGDKCFYAEEDAIAPLWKGKRFPMSACISGWVMLNRKAAVIEDIYADPRIPADAYRPTFVKSLAMVPIRTQDPIGAIGNYWATKRMPPPETVRLLEALANFTSIAIENADLYASLERRVQERTRDLAEANHELEAFSYSVSHDLRTPLRHMDGFLGLLKKALGPGPGAEAARLLGKVEDSVKRMDLLIADLLAFSRMGRAEMRSCRVDLAGLLSQVKEELSEDIRGRSVAWNMGELPEVEGDPDLLRQVLANLVGNAVKFTRKQPQAAIEVGAAPVKDGRAVIYVRDNGAGFDMAYAERLFGLFQRLHLQEDYEGTGIGLANVRRIIKRHGGEVWADSAPGKGATFYFTLALPAKAR
ncbi:MAG: ATP-binding protein [Elusimicrobiales bacterium]|nr:ATP-binding protein [Elusimicrobiales bacterium]